MASATADIYTRAENANMPSADPSTLSDDVRGMTILLGYIYLVTNIHFKSLGTTH